MLALGVVGLAPRARADEPSHGAAPVAEPDVARDGPWALELMIVAEPPQPVETSCGGQRDCLTASKAWFGGAARASFHAPEVVHVTTTLGLATIVDQEERPPSYGVLSLRLDAQIEIGRRADRFGAALRASQVALMGWSDDGVDVTTDFPGAALVLGTTRLWGEVALRTIPSPPDPRGFHLALGMQLERWSGTAGVCTLGTLGMQHGELAEAGTTFGAYGDVTMRVTERFDLRLMAIVAQPVLLTLGFGWRFAR